MKCNIDDIESFFKVLNEIKRIVNKIVARMGEHSMSGIDDISRGRKSFKVSFWRLTDMNYRNYHIKIPFEGTTDKKLQNEFIKEQVKKFTL